MNQPPGRWAIRPLTPEAVYTDRQEHLEYLHKVALNAIERRATSTVLLGQRRMGKTEIFKRVVNRLFFEQEAYVENFMRWYVAFRLRDLRLLSKEDMPSGMLPDFVQDNLKETGRAMTSPKFYRAIAQHGVNNGSGGGSRWKGTRQPSFSGTWIGSIGRSNGGSPTSWATWPKSTWRSCSGMVSDSGCRAASSTASRMWSFPGGSTAADLARLVLRARRLHPIREVRPISLSHR